MSVAPLSTETLEVRTRLAALCRDYHGRGWMLGTSGNLSARVDDRLVITASGRHKGRVATSDFVELSADGAVTAAGPDARPSAETSIHVEIYRARPAVSCVLHVHTVSSTLAGLKGLETPERSLDFRGLEMVKGWGLWEEHAEAKLSCFANHTHVPDISKAIAAHLAQRSSHDEVPALLIAGHGITAWGASVDEAHRHVEVTEFLSQVAMAR